MTKSSWIIKKFFFCPLLFLILTTQSLDAKNRIIVSKKQFKLIVLNSVSDTLCCYKCAIGHNLGNKQYVGDKRTPEGKFLIATIEDSKLWSHDFNDGAGDRPYAYGPYFIRLKTPRWRGIGIHGTCFPESIGTRSTEGCIRLNNDDLLDLIKYIEIGTEVIIEKDN